ncbi:MAG: AMP-binding protein [Candidatus Dormibacteria bacterium]
MSGDRGAGDAPPGTLRELLAEIERRGPVPAVTLVDARLSAADLGDVGRRAANVLAGLGVSPGDTVLTVCDNGLAQVAAWLGCIELGAVFAPLNTLLVGTPLAEVAAHSGARVLVCQERHRAGLEAVRGLMPAVDTVVVAGGGGEQAFEARLERAEGSGQAHPTGAASPGAPARLMYTSGTTGDPKGVIWSRRAETLHALAYGDELVRIEPGEHVYSCLPLFHATCQGTLLGTLWRGGHVTVDERFSPFTFWERVRECGAVFFPYVGTLLATLDRRPPRPGDADNPVRRVMGSAAPAERWRAIEERFQLCIEDVWGQTETASCWTRPQQSPATPGTVGAPVDRFAARLLTAEGRDAPPGVLGELLVRPHQAHVMFEGYLGEPSPWSEDGWYRTGDLMSWREDGDLVFAGRERDAIRRHGEMLSPSQIEAVASQLPGAGGVAAVAVPASDGVEDEILLCLTGAVPLPEVDRFLAERLPSVLRPRYYRHCDSLPMTPTTKVRRQELRRLGAGGAWDRHRPGGAEA